MLKKNKPNHRHYTIKREIGRIHYYIKRKKKETSLLYNYMYIMYSFHLKPCGLFYSFHLKPCGLFYSFHLKPRGIGQKVDMLHWN